MNKPSMKNRIRSVLPIGKEKKDDVTGELSRVELLDKLMNPQPPTDIKPPRRLPETYECYSCGSDLTHNPRICSADHPGFDLCLDCFANKNNKQRTARSNQAEEKEVHGRTGGEHLDKTNFVKPLLEKVPSRTKVLTNLLGSKGSKELDDCCSMAVVTSKAGKEELWESTMDDVPISITVSPSTAKEAAPTPAAVNTIKPRSPFTRSSSQGHSQTQDDGLVKRGERIGPSRKSEHTSVLLGQRRRASVQAYDTVEQRRKVSAATGAPVRPSTQYADEAVEKRRRVASSTLGVLVRPTPQKQSSGKCLVSRREHAFNRSDTELLDTPPFQAERRRSLNNSFNKSADKLLLDAPLEDDELEAMQAELSKLTSKLNKQRAERLGRHKESYLRGQQKPQQQSSPKHHRHHHSVTQRRRPFLANAAPHPFSCSDTHLNKPPADALLSENKPASFRMQQRRRSSASTTDSERRPSLK
mgnify:CR=1 FL=1